jgi:hypothetical protein
MHHTDDVSTAEPALHTSTTGQRREEHTRVLPHGGIFPASRFLLWSHLTYLPQHLGYKGRQRLQGVKHRGLSGETTCSTRPAT